MKYPKILKISIGIFLLVAYAYQPSFGMIAFESDNEKKEQISSSDVKNNSKLQGKFNELLLKATTTITQPVALQKIKNIIIKVAKQAMVLGIDLPFDYWIFIVFREYLAVFLHEGGHALASLIFLQGFDLLKIGQNNRWSFPICTSPFLKRLGIGDIFIESLLHDYQAPLFQSGEGKTFFSGKFPLDGTTAVRDVALKEVIGSIVTCYASFPGEFMAYFLSLSWILQNHNPEIVLSSFQTLPQEKDLFQFFRKLIITTYILNGPEPFVHEGISKDYQMTGLIGRIFYCLTPLERNYDGGIPVDRLFGSGTFKYLQDFSKRCLPFAKNVVLFKALKCVAERFGWLDYFKNNLKKCIVGLAVVGIMVCFIIPEEVSSIPEVLSSSCRKCFGVPACMYAARGQGRWYHLCGNLLFTKEGILNVLKSGVLYEGGMALLPYIMSLGTKGLAFLLLPITWPIEKIYNRLSLTSKGKKLKQQGEEIFVRAKEKIAALTTKCREKITSIEKSTSKVYTHVQNNKFFKAICALYAFYFWYKLITTFWSSV